MSLRSVSGLWLRDHADWKWFVTLTFRDHQTPERGLDAVKWWLRRIAGDVVRQHLRFAVATDLDPNLGTLHFHLLLAWERRSLVFTPDLADGLWKRAPCFTGNTKVERYNPELGGPEYLVGHDDWDLNVACPRRGRCKKKGCEVAPGGW